MALTLWLLLQAVPQAASAESLFADLYAGPAEAGLVEAASAPDEPEPEPAALQSATKVLDFQRLEVEPRLGLLLYGGDADADPEVGGGFLTRAPMPWLNPKLKPSGDYFGLFLEFTFSTMDRDLDPPPSDDTSGTVFFIGLGVDYTIRRDKRWLILAQLGFEYGNFGGIADTEDGVAILAGGMVGLRLTPRIQVGYNPQFHIAFTSDWVMLNHIGVIIQF